MAHSLERRWAKLVESYARLKRLYERSVEHRRILSDELRDANAEVTRLTREALARERASKRTLGKLVSVCRYTASHLRDLGDEEAAEKIEIWCEEIDDAMLPVADVRVIVSLLEEWAGAFPCDDRDKTTVLYMRTMKELHDLNGEP